MSKAAQYYNALTQEWSQLPAGGLTTDDYTLNTGIIADQFQTIKDSQDNLYIICNYSGSQYSAGMNTAKSKVIKLSKTGVILATYTYSSGANYATLINPILSRDQETIFFSNYNAVIVTMNAGVFTEPSIAANKFAIYKDLYIWVASGTTVKVYDYNVPHAVLGSATVESESFIVVDSNNICYTHSKTSNYFTVRKLVFDGEPSVSNTLLYNPDSYSNLTYQMAIDTFGDLIFLNDATNTRLIKFSTATNDIIDTKDLGQKCYNLAIDTKGNYYYQTALATFKIDKNTIQGQVFNPIPAEPMRATGSTGYGSNMTGYQPSVYS